MTPNFLILLLAALVPIVMGFIWYNPKTFGKAWMQSADMTEEKMKGANMPLIFGLTFLFSFFIAFSLQFMVIHQYHLYSILYKEPGFHDAGSPVNTLMNDFMAKYGQNFRTFKHGVGHGILGALFLVVPIIGINALFERKGFKYIAINGGFWIVCMAIMGGIICAFS